MSLANNCYLTSEQKQSFNDNGYLKLPKAISPLVLKQLIDAVDTLCALGEQLPDNSVLEAANKQKFVVAIDKIIEKPTPIFAELLGSPLLLSIAESLCGADFFPVQDFIVIKTLGDQNEVKWHQDVVTVAHEKTFMIGFYLDPATDENGALRVIPNSHKSNSPICELQKMDYQAIDMAAGDILIHNLKMAHSSGELTTFSQRRVVYFEFMSASEILKEQGYPASFVASRTSSIPNAIRCFQNANPSVQPFEWRHPQKDNYAVATDPHLFIQELSKGPKKVKAANYCFDFVGGSSIAPTPMV